MFHGRVVPGAGIVVKKDDLILMILVVRLGHIRWELPAGRFDSTDTNWEATAIREGKEETGLIVQPSKPIGVCWHYSNRRRAGWMGMFFDATVGGEQEIPEKKQFGNVDFQQIQEDEKLGFRNTNLEDILTVGYIDMEKVDIRRVHPLHVKLLQAHSAHPDEIVFVAADGEEDYINHSTDIPIFY